MTWVLPYMFTMYFDHVNFSCPLQILLISSHFPANTTFYFHVYFWRRCHPMNFVRVACRSMGEGSFIGSMHVVSVAVWNHVDVHDLCRPLRPWSVLPPKAILGSVFLLHLGPMWISTALLPSTVKWMSRSVLPPAAIFSSADCVAVRGCVDAWDCIAAEGHDGVCGLWYDQGRVDVCGLYSHQKLHGSSWPVSLLTVKGNVAPFAVVVMTADSQLTMRAPEGFCDCFSPPRPPPKRNSLDSNY